MMNKKGFTLIELLAVIAIIGILSLVVVPNLMNVRKNINNRLAEEKKEHIISAAELYATNNPDIFGGTDVVYVSVQELIDAEYLEIDVKVDDSECNIAGGCISNPAYQEDESSNLSPKFFNSSQIKLTKKSAGVVAEFSTGEEASSSSATLVEKVCEGFGNSYIGKTLDGSICRCSIDNHIVSLIKDAGGAANECILVSKDENGNVNNWLKYGSSDANWRVIGLYDIDGNVSAKMITANIIEE